jgi:membrane protein DedA with SNARE-associated domain
VVVLRHLNGIVAGTAKMPWPKFLLPNATGGLLWTVAWGLGTCLGAESLGVLTHHAARALAAWPAGS